MRHAVTGLLILLWIVVGYVVLLWIAKRFFTGRYRAETASAAVVVAFILGANFPRPALQAAAGGAAAATGAPSPESAASPVMAAVVRPMVDVGAACGTARITTVAGKGNVDTTSVEIGAAAAPAGSGTQLQGGDILIERGWAANQSLTGPATSVCAVVDGKIVSGVKVLYGGSRPDVAAVYQNSALGPTAYEISLPSARVKPGMHHVQAAAVMADGSAVLLSGGVLVAGPPLPGKS